MGVHVSAFIRHVLRRFGYLRIATNDTVAEQGRYFPRIMIYLMYLQLVARRESKLYKSSVSYRDTAGRVAVSSMRVRLQDRSLLAPEKARQRCTFPENVAEPCSSYRLA